MAPADKNSSKWRRIYQQTITLSHKNFLIFYASPAATLARAFFFPIFITLALCLLKYLSYNSFNDLMNGGVEISSTPVKGLADAMMDASRYRLVLVRNGTSTVNFNSFVEGINAQTGMASMSVLTTNDPNDLYDLCEQSVTGLSNCYAAVVFRNFDEATVSYAIAIDGIYFESPSDSAWRTGNTFLNQQILPIQWAVDAQIGGFSDLAPPRTRAYSGIIESTQKGEDDNNDESDDVSEVPSAVWLGLIRIFIAPLFILLNIGLVYHLSTFVSKERETSMAELMGAQGVTTVPRIMSTCIAFFLAYLPGLFICSILITQILFTHTSDILFLLLVILSTASLVTSSHFIASMFGKAQTASLFASIGTFALALISMVSGTFTDTLILDLGLTLLFPPMTWTILIKDLAIREIQNKGFALGHQERLTYDDPVQVLDGYLYFVILVVQILVFPFLTYYVERRAWGVNRTAGKIEAQSGVALRCIGLSKTYYSRRPWYWPCITLGRTVKAVQSFDFEIQKGSVNFLLGPNGGGKTTTLRCLAGMLSMDKGSQLLINETENSFGICPQKNVVWEDLTVQQHMDVWKKLKAAALENNVSDSEDVIAECDLIHKTNAAAKTLSGGQIRKLQLAIAFVGGSKICCIDEASSGLDPLSRRNIWSIIQNGFSRRTILATSHFLDEADILSDHIFIVNKGKLICEGPGTSLKARFGNEYEIRASESDVITSKGHYSTSIEATRKIMELESQDLNHSYDLIFPTLEQVFLNVTSDHFVQEQEQSAADTRNKKKEIVVSEELLSGQKEKLKNSDLEVGQPTTLSRQIWVLFTKRYLLLRHTSHLAMYCINLFLPIIVAGVALIYFRKFRDIRTCQMNEDHFKAGLDQFADPTFPFFRSTESPVLSITEGDSAVILGPRTNPIQDDLFTSILGDITLIDQSVSIETRLFKDAPEADQKLLVADINGMVGAISNYSQQYYRGVGIFAETPQTATFFYPADSNSKEVNSRVFALLTNQIANATAERRTARITSATITGMQHVMSSVDGKILPLTALLIIAITAAASIPIIYPAFEKKSRVRALHYCNGVSPFALWTAYLMFDMQFVFVQSLAVWIMLFSGALQRIWYSPGYIFGALLLFGMATALGTYVLSLFVKRAPFAIAAGIHITLFAVYFMAYVLCQVISDKHYLHQSYTYVQVMIGLLSPAANLGRALFISGNVFDILCGQFGRNDISNPFSYDRYGSVYANLIFQIIFLIGFLVIYEYGSSDWIHRTMSFRGSSLTYQKQTEYGSATELVQYGATIGTSNTEPKQILGYHTERIMPLRILDVAHICKSFGNNVAVQNISFDISANETLALLGGNGAGKTTTFNMIRGEIRPDSGDIFVNGRSVSKQLRLARSQMGVCPQHDAVDNLTVRQTLQFYATVKGLRDVKGNVDRVMAALGIAIYENSPAESLSGGTLRKLSVAVALLGNPRILLLDEPSTGQDAGAKRVLWRASQSISADRAILLTTHSMEEAEALASSVAIVGTRMLATGTMEKLQQTYGGRYSIRAIRNPNGSNASDVENTLREKFLDMGLAVIQYTDSHGQISFCLPHDRKKYSKVLLTMEELKGTLDLLNYYSVTGPTLEEVFINVASGGLGPGGV
ncbi:ABC transporter [Phlyctema vagabunda]|uniref:ABC transporter n=1 Tax=Phlyctema vagabunda TaxID=108571 RepID=A0ABR4P3J6_9HELO